MTTDVVAAYGIKMDGVTDNAPQLARLQADLVAMDVAKKPLPKVVFPEGICVFSRWPNFAIPNLWMAGEGRCYLRYTGTEDAVVFDGEHNGYPFAVAGRNVTFENFHIIPSATGKNGLVITCCHRSHFNNINVHGAGINPVGSPYPYAAIRVRSCVLLEMLNPTVSNFESVTGPRLVASTQCAGILLETIPDHPTFETSSCRFINPVLETLHTGVLIHDSAYCHFVDGTIEQCSIGVNLESGGNNCFWRVEMEGNGTDIIIGSSAANNYIWQPLKVSKSVSGFNNVVAQNLWGLV